MDVIVETNPQTASQAGTDLLATLIRRKPTLKAVLATGNTPMDMYSRLAALKNAGKIDAGQMTVFQLDAYLDVPDTDPRSLYGWMDRSFIQPMDIPATQVHRFRETSHDPHGDCVRYADTIRASGGFDLAVLGLGPNGHLGFNEPPSAADATTRVVTLTPESIISNAVYWGGIARVPKVSVTVGMDALLASSQIILIATGAHKHNILRRTVEGPVTPDVPSSFLQTAAKVTIITDRAAWEGDR